ncbi:MAG: ligase [Rhizobacter sp.]|nr:ligase [Rhizobacter sp.]
MLAEHWRAGLALDAYWVSEKFDGVRGYWDGHRLLSRGGVTIAAPAWFTAGWPDEPLDGELWAGHGRFEQASSTVGRDPPDDVAWRGMRFMVFDVPGRPGTFDERLPLLRDVVRRIDHLWVQAVEQRKLTSPAALGALLARTVDAGGEGLVLHRGASLYRGGRSDDLLKLKPFDDAEATVIGLVAGRGKYVGMMGALLLRTPDGTTFRLGSGFSDENRHHPPPLGSIVTYRYRGTHSGGIPRFASYMRLRSDASLQAPATPIPQPDR